MMNGTGMGNDLHLQVIIKCIINVSIKFNSFYT